MSAGNLLATSDLHVTHQANRELVDRIRPHTDGDWLIVAGDVAERISVVESTLRLLRDRFAKVIWTPGNHELWTVEDDPAEPRGEHRYRLLVETCRRLDVITPEDPYPVWETGEESFVVAPLFVLYDYSFREPDTTVEQALRYAHEVGLVFSDEYLLHPDPYASRQEWCWQRVAATERRLAALPRETRTILVSHWPLHPGPTRMLRHPHLAMWCGTRQTADWHLRFRAAAAVYGHLHIPLTRNYDEVPFVEASLGYPREWRRRPHSPEPLRRIPPVESANVSPGRAKGPR